MVVKRWLAGWQFWFICRFCMKIIVSFLLTCATLQQVQSLVVERILDVAVQEVLCYRLYMIPTICHGSSSECQVNKP